MDYLTSYKENGCQKVLKEAKAICEENSIESKFQDQQRPAAGRITVTNEENFHTNVFVPIVESTINSINERFNTLNKHNELFSFLYDFKSYEANRANGSLLESCKNLEVALKRRKI